MSRRLLGIFLNFKRRTDHPHPSLDAALENYASILRDLGWSEAEIAAELDALLGKYGIESNQ